VPGEILFAGKDNIFAWVGEHKSASQMNQGVKCAPEVDGAKEFCAIDQSLLFGLDTDRQRAILSD